VNKVEVELELKIVSFIEICTYLAKEGSSVAFAMEVQNPEYNVEGGLRKQGNQTYRV
jgi:hypothetical protein